MCTSTRVCLGHVRYFSFVKQKTAYEVRISDWSATCALPISRPVTTLPSPSGVPPAAPPVTPLVTCDKAPVAVVTTLLTSVTGVPAAPPARPPVSPPVSTEEGRVGTECVSQCRARLCP